MPGSNASSDGFDRSPLHGQDDFPNEDEPYEANSGATQMDQHPSAPHAYGVDGGAEQHININTSAAAMNPSATEG